jgi:hypothetical protein
MKTQQNVITYKSSSHNLRIERGAAPSRDINGQCNTLYPIVFSTKSSAKICQKLTTESARSRPCRSLSSISWPLTPCELNKKINENIRYISSKGLVEAASNERASAGKNIGTTVVLIKHRLGP